VQRAAESAQLRAQQHRQEDNKMTKEEFIERVFELAFGDDAINRDFSYEEVLGELEMYSCKEGGRQ